ncbi:MAG: sodium:calcium antiporter, partial [Actinomycetia bacterium]|nr:sodium:calcium antiporter [Actinomycetes bacterium]
MLLLLGSVLAGVGGEFFVRGLVTLGVWWRVPPGIVGATVGAFATSAPEMSVAVNSAVAGRPEIALGDVLGSNVVNIGLILGIALLFAAILV